MRFLNLLFKKRKKLELLKRELIIEKTNYKKPLKSFEALYRSILKQAESEIKEYKSYHVTTLYIYLTPELLELAHREDVFTKNIEIPESIKTINIRAVYSSNEKNRCEYFLS
jgi:hypothetical protein